ncbi:prefoldin subunit alpha [archaeon]|jgi:prefoldin alpha subunit|nr:prefoldin subunit alpha [archaeon]MBT4397029.1 prefoldin subunit alpha [archaeon]MBT4441020.1 prefoldin subunit alpha [archaeon]
MNQNNVLEGYQNMQEFNNQLQAMQQQVDVLEKQTVELNTVKEGLDSIEQCNGDEEILIPLGSGIFLKGGIKDKAQVTMNVGAGIVVEKSISGALKLVEEQIVKMGSFKEELTKEMGEISMTLQKLQLEMQKTQKE